jgi:hypothetical protein
MPAASPPATPTTAGTASNRSAEQVAWVAAR